MSDEGAALTDWGSLGPRAPSPASGSQAGEGARGPSRTPGWGSAQLAAAFETLAEAPDGIKRLRELVLQLAVRGKLVPQIEGEVPWAETGAEGLFEVPVGWVWARVTDCFDVVGGIQKTGRRTPINNVCPYLRVANVQRGRLDLEEVEHFELFEGELERWRLKVGDLLIVEGNGSETEVGRCARWDGQIDPCVHQNHLMRCRPKVLGIERFVLLYLNSPPGTATMKSLAVTTSGLFNLSVGKIRQINIPLPPLAEQHRIVARVDALMSLLDRLETARNAREATRAALRDAALAALRDADTHEEVETAWQRIAERMPDLFTDPADLVPLRQTVLQLAVRGRLVRQDPSDRPIGLPASDGLFEVPASWCWVRIRDCFGVVGGIQKTSLRRSVANAYPYLRVANVQRGRLELAEIEQFELFDGELERWCLKAGDLLVVEGNGSSAEVGRCARWGGEIDPCVHQNHLMRCRPNEPGIEHFVLVYLNSPSGMATMKALAVTTSGLFNLSVGKIRQIVVPIPPLAEQHRIVAKVNELTTLIHRLEHHLTTAREAQTAFAAAAVHHLDA
jgi:type I restriction enzyme S subunit